MPDTNWTIRIAKSWSARDLTRSWVNTYELVSGAPASPTDLIPVLSTLVAAEKTLHRNLVQFLQGTISTWVPDSKPYTGLNFVTVEQSGTGNLGLSSGDTLDSNVCFVVKFTAPTGRQGRRFYRGCLSEDDNITSSDGHFNLAGTSGFIDTGAVMSNFRTALAPVLPGGNALAQLYLFGKGLTFPSTARAVNGVRSGGITVNKHNHRYFDRH